MKPNSFLEKTLRTIKKVIPAQVFRFFQPAYHFVLGFLGALVYRFPAQEITVVTVTGTKGKTTTTELIAHILRASGKKVALSNTVHFVINEKETKNLYKMSTPGRFFVQGFLRKAINAGCEVAVMEVTSQAVLQHRHRWLAPDAFVFTNLSPEHIEAHGSYENYRDAKLEIAHELERSNKPERHVLANIDDKEAGKFLDINVEHTHPFSLDDVRPIEETASGTSFRFHNQRVESNLPGRFNVYNQLAAAKTAQAIGVEPEQIVEALNSFKGIRGRLEAIDEGQPFGVYVDYAHTPDSLKKVYETFDNAKKICVLGNTGGGRDKWKRREMAKIAESHCSQIILTNEDPYDEDPRKIVEEMARAISIPKYEIIMDRREAMRHAFELAEADDVVLITGKGTDPFIMGPNGTKEPWDDASVAREELKKNPHQRSADEG